MSNCITASKLDLYGHLSTLLLWFIVMIIGIYLLKGIWLDKTSQI